MSSHHKAPCILSLSTALPFHSSFDAFCDFLEGRDGERREAQEGRNICVIMPDLHCCTAETNITL